MGLFVSKAKLKAATYSMHQYCPHVRTVFPVGEVDDAVVEASTLYLYLHTARDVMGARFTRSLAEMLQHRLRSSPERVMTILGRLNAMTQSMHGNEEYHEVITRIIHAMLSEAGCDTHDQPTLQGCFARFQAVAGPIGKHLQGIKRQNVWVMKRAA